MEVTGATVVFVPQAKIESTIECIVANGGAAERISTSDMEQYSKDINLDPQWTGLRVFHSSKVDAREIMAGPLKRVL